MSRLTIPIGTDCSLGGCLNGVCGAVFPCTENGIPAAIAKGGGPYTFDCAPGEHVIETTSEIVIDKDWRDGLKTSSSAGMSKARRRESCLVVEAPIAS